MRTGKFRGLVSLIAGLALLWLWPDISARANDAVVFEINQLLTSEGRLELPIENRRLDLIGFYAAQDPLFIGTPRAEQLLQRMRNCHRDGLDPKDYPVGFLQQLLDGTAAGDAANKAQAELWFTAHFLQFAADMKTGRVVPKKLYPDIFLPAKTINDGNVLAALTQFESMDAFFDAWEPAVAGYAELHAALGRYMEIAASGGWDSVESDREMHKGHSGPDVAAVRARLAAEQDLAESDQPDIFGDDLEKAVKLFQRRHGLTASGIVDKQTRLAMNVGVEQRVDQIVLALERVRWLPERFARNTLVIDKARGTATLGSGGDALEWTVYPNCPERNPVIGTSTLRALTVNPAWEVPFDYFQEVLLPRLRSDAKSVEGEGYRLFMSNVPQPLSSWPWQSVTDSFLRERRQEFRVRMAPGKANPLGRFIYNMGNSEGVFLFEAPAGAPGDLCDPRLPATAFAIAQGLEIAPSLLDPRVAGFETLARAASRGETVTYPANGTIQVIIIFRPAWAGADGTVHFGYDAYLEDRRLKEALAARRVPE